MRLVAPTSRSAVAWAGPRSANYAPSPPSSPTHGSAYPCPGTRTSPSFSSSHAGCPMSLAFGDMGDQESPPPRNQRRVLTSNAGCPGSQDADPPTRLGAPCPLAFGDMGNHESHKPNSPALRDADPPTRLGAPCPSPLGTWETTNLPRPGMGDVSLPQMPTGLIRYRRTGGLHFLIFSGYIGPRGMPFVPRPKQAFFRARPAPSPPRLLKIHNLCLAKSYRHE